MASEQSQELGPKSINREERLMSLPLVRRITVWRREQLLTWLHHSCRGAAHEQEDSLLQGAELISATLSSISS